MSYARSDGIVGTDHLYPQRETLAQEVARLRAENARLAERVGELEEKAAMIDAVEANHWTLRAVDVRHDDDADVAWQVIEHYMAAPHEREVGYGSTPERAIRDVANRLAAEPQGEEVGDE